MHLVRGDKMAKTIKESAELLGISTQAIYKRIKNMDDNQLATFLTTDENGVRMLTEVGLEFIGGDRKEAASITDDAQGVEKGQSSQETMVTWLQEEISKLNDELKVERENSRELTRKLIKITENQQALLGHNMGMKQVETHAVQSIDETEEVVEKATVTEEAAVKTTDSKAEDTPIKEEDSKGFFSRLFKK